MLVPGQVFSREILQFMRDLDTPEIHGYLPNFGYRVYTEKAIETVSASTGSATHNGHRAPGGADRPAPQKPSEKKPTKRAGTDDDGNVPEVGQDELIGRQYPGDAADTTV
ncbi:hypothetical protein A5673_27005 [Mycobacterium sp. E3198]|nr:hypothetical protein A5673_27005 [Mycobacterium sp. E3198]